MVQKYFPKKFINIQYINGSIYLAQFYNTFLIIEKNNSILIYNIYGKT